MRSSLRSFASKLNKLFSDSRGQGMTEYIIIVALIAIAAIAVVTLFGNNIRKVFGASSDALAGDTAVTNTGLKSTNVTKLKTLTNFGENAQ